MAAEIQSNQNQPNSSSSKYLVKGDISGIQGFIFNVNSSLAAQSLKGRSFFIKVLLQLGMKMIFDKFEIQEQAAQNAAKISTSGGNFVLLINIDNPNDIDDIQDRLNNALQYTGLNILLSFIPFGEDYGASLKALNQKIRERKHTLLLGKHDFFEPFERTRTTNINDNKKWVNITKQLKETTHFNIHLSESATGNGELSIVGNQLKLAGYDIQFSKGINNGGIALEDYLESLFPAPSTFEELADGRLRNGHDNAGGPNTYEKGIKKLGVLVMDVDNLGSTLENVSMPKSHFDFDEDLKSFFNKRLREIINKPVFKDRVYVVTAGGDDSYFVGKWNVLLDLALEIKKEFHAKFSSKGLSISAALVIVTPNFPVVRFAEMADDAIKDAKYKYQDCKGNINLFGEVLDWDMLENEINDLRSKFNGNSKELITSGLLTKARKTSLKIAEGEGIMISDFWKLGYYMRNFKGKGSKILKDYFDYLNKATIERNPVKKKTYKLIFAVASRLAEYDKRKN